MASSAITSREGISVVDELDGMRDRIRRRAYADHVSREGGSMSLVRWDPFRELEEMSTRLNRLFNQPSGRRLGEDEGSLLAEWAPAVDVQETDAEYLIKADLPEVKREDVRVELQDGMICVQGERRQEKEENGKKFHRIERAYGRFERRLALPSEIDAQKVAAEFKDGVLKIHLPKSEMAKPRSIPVKVS